MKTESEWLVETTDYEGTWVVLASATWQTKVIEHPEVKGYLDEVGKTIQSPDLVYSSTRDERSRVFYRLYVGRDEWQGKHLVVVVKYVEETQGRRGYVSTLYRSRAVYSRGELLWKSQEQHLRFE